MKKLNPYTLCLVLMLSTAAVSMVEAGQPCGLPSSPCVRIVVPASLLTPHVVPETLRPQLVVPESLLRQPIAPENLCVVEAATPANRIPQKCPILPGYTR